MKDAFLAALPYMPRHRARSKRSASLTLDDLLDEGRAQQALAGGALDLVLMGYRLSHVFADAVQEFTPKKVKPDELLDLWQLAFAALLSRDRTPGPVLVSEAVEAAKSTFGPHVASITNAFLRRAAREREDTLASLEEFPERALGRELAGRWSSEPALRKRLARAAVERPESGIPSIDAEGRWESRPLEAFQDGPPLQALDAGSWDLCRWLAERWSARLSKGEPWLDACAAPGGKLIGLTVASGSRAAFATESRFPRLERLRSNLSRWKMADAKTALHAWGEENPKSEGLPREWPDRFSMIVADLPCSGTGTLASRPDLLLEDIGARVRSLKPVQEKILAALRPKLAPGGELAVILCSIDPEEIATVTGALGAEPVYRSFDRSPERRTQGLVAWVVS
jgi:16S rRNA (cytosine967-C5)-methyltransferase